MILVDAIRTYPAHLTRGLPGQAWCHMVSDESEAELHAFAKRIGLRRAWAQLRPAASAAHYDLTPARRARAVAAGAAEVTSKELVARNFDGRTRRAAADPIPYPVGFKTAGRRMRRTGVRRRRGLL